MRYNPIPKTEEDLTDYRGSIVHLASATDLRNSTDPCRHADDDEPDRHDMERRFPGPAKRLA
jgi:hypothetical protein